MVRNLIEVAAEITSLGHFRQRRRDLGARPLADGLTP